VAVLALVLSPTRWPAPHTVAAAPVLVAAYSFNEGTGTTLTDHSGNGNNGTLANGPTWTAAGKYSGALNFDGSNDIVNINDSATLDLTAGMTLEAWVRPTTGTNWRTILMKERPGHLTYGLYANTSSPSRPAVEVATTSGGNVELRGSAQLPTNAWSHVAATFDGWSLTLYVNGNQVGSLPASGSLITSSNALRIGGNAIWGEYFRGQIDDVRIYNEALTQAQLQSDMNTPVAAAAPDSIPPSVSMTAPANNATVNGSISVSANASDNVGVVGVRFAVDGANIGAEDTSAPYSVTWNTASVSNGPHSLTAIARDAAGNVTTSAAVTVTVDNFVDATPPSVSMTSPANNATVNGSISVTANASDNVGVVGVRFAADGVNIGGEDTSAPYSVAWDTTSVSNGPHSLTAIARDAAGHVTTSAAVTVTADNFSDVTPPAVALTAPADGSEVQGTINLAATASDDVGVVSVQFTANGANIGSPDTTPPYSANWNTNPFANGTYTLAAVARDAANNSTISAPVSVTVNNSITLGVLNGHAVAGDGSNAIVSWLGPAATAYELSMEIAWDFLLNRVPTESNGMNTLFTQSYLHSGSLHPSGWENNPADKNAGIIESALAYYAYSGDDRVITLARQLADYQLDNGMTAASGVWPSVPYASGCGGCLIFDGTGSDGQGYIEPDKVASLGLQLLKLHRHTGVARYRDAALASANALAANIRPGNATSSPWPFRVHAQNGTVKEDYTAHVIPAIELFEALSDLNLGNVAAYQSARTAALNWLMAYPMQNDVWVNYFEDVGVQGGLSNINNVSPLETAYHLLQHPEDDPDWQTHVPELIAWVENRLSVSQFGANAIREQAVFPFPMGSHTARYAAVNALYYELTGSTAARDKAYRAYNWATYMISSSPQGQIIDGPDVNNIWFSDGYGDFIRHFMRGIAAVPAWAPDNETHIVDSTAVIKSVTYSPGTVDYTTDADSSIEKIKVDFVPQEVTAGGLALPQRTDLSAQGWVYDAASRLLSVRHDGGTQIHVSDTAAVDTIAPVISAVGAANITSQSVTISWTTNELTNAQIEFGTTTEYLESTGVFPNLAMSHSITITGLSAETVYYYRVKSRDASGNLATADGFTFVTLAADTAVPSVSITAPADASVIAGTVTVAADASDNVGVTGVRFLLDGANLGTEDTTAPYAISWNTGSVPNGSYTLTAIARDAAGNSTLSTSVVVTVDNSFDTTPPSVGVTAPAGGSTVAGSVAISADAFDDVGIVGVQFLLNGLNLGAEDTAAPYTLTWDSTTVANGAHTLTARARDAAGNATTSAAVDITVSNAQAVVVDFNSHPSYNANLDGQYPSGVINWGTNVWYLSAPFGQFATKSISFNGPGITSGTISFVNPKRLVSVRAYNGGPTTTTLTFSCSGNPTRTVSVGAGQLQTISTTWGAACSNVTFTSSNGWDTNLDDLVFDGGL
jgi:hypothetical protein